MRLLNILIGSVLCEEVSLSLDDAYDIFRTEYEASTGKSWSKPKFLSRAANWQFYGDDDGYVAVRKQRSGFVKLVGMAGANKSKLRGFREIASLGEPLWGLVSKEILRLASRVGLREPSEDERDAIMSAITPQVMGDASIVGYTDDRGVIIDYPDVGKVTKYLVGTEEYYRKLRGMFGE